MHPFRLPIKRGPRVSQKKSSKKFQNIQMTRRKIKEVNSKKMRKNQNSINRIGIMKGNNLATRLSASRI